MEHDFSFSHSVEIDSQKTRFQPTISSNLPEEIKIEVTKRCNLKCHFCFNEQEQKGMDEPSLEKIEGWLKKLSDEGIDAVRITGGEPLLRQDITKILKLCKKYDFYTILNTNGTFITKENMYILDPVDDILLSFHIPVSDILNTIKLIKENTPGINIRVCTILTEDNIKNLEEFYKIISRTEVDDWFFLRPIPNKSYKGLIDKKIIKELCIKIPLLNEEYDKDCCIRNTIPFCCGEKNKLRNIAKGNMNDSGHTRLVIDCNGNIKPDYFSSKILGNIESHSITKIWNSEIMKKVRKNRLLPEECRQCDVKEECKGGLLFYNDPLINRD